MVKVGPIEQHLVSKGFPDAKEISLLIHLDRVISEWITRAIVRAGRSREANYNCDHRYKCCDMHIQNALVSTWRACTDGSEAERDLESLDARYYPKAQIRQGADRAPPRRGTRRAETCHDARG